MLTQSGCNRVAAEIIGHKHGWYYDNLKVKPHMFDSRKSIATTLKQFADRITESGVRRAWQEAVRRTHGACTDGMVKTNVPGYTIECFREAMGVECDKESP